MKANFSPRTGLVLAAALLLPAARLAAIGGSTRPEMMGLDQNHNQLSDLYESLYPGLTSADADDDRDGQTNRAENAAGTNPHRAADRLDFSAVSMEIAGIATEWATQPGKEYQLQSAVTLTGPWINESAAVTGDGTPLTFTTPRTGSLKFMRLEVRDIDSDADGVTDWEEIKVGTDPALADSDGDGRTDAERITGRLQLSNRINAVATQSRGVEDGSIPVIFRLVRTGNLNPITVSYTMGGTAQPGTDYPAPSGTAIFPMGAATAVVTITPTADGLTEGTESLTLTISPGSGYLAGQQPTATASLDDARSGLLGRYFNTQETAHPGLTGTNANFNPAQLKLVRVDGPIDFNWGAGPPPGTGLTDPNGWSVRWQGKLIPPVTGNYLFHLAADRGGVLSINGTTLITQWATALTTEHVSAAIPLTAGVPVNIQLDNRESSTTPSESGIRLLWTPPGGPKALIPFNAFSCAPSVNAAGSAPVLTGPPYAFALRNAPFSYQVSSAPSAMSWQADGLPSGLTIDAVTGLVSGRTSAPAGLVTALITGSNAEGSGTLQLPILILEGGGGLTREVWTGLTGSGIGSIPLATAPAAMEPLTSLEAPADAGDQFGDRLRGYLTVPTSGNYTFFLAGDSTAEFWLSSSEEPGHRLKRSWVTNSNLAPGAWTTLAGQRSLPVRLTAGKRYYLEAIRRETTGPDHLAIGWQRPGQSSASPPEIIPGWALSPYTPPSAATPDGTLYIANLTPQAGAATLGTGSAVLFVNKAKTTAELTFTWSNLTGPIISEHLHDSQPVPGPAGAIIFDIDDEVPDAAGVRHWTFTPTGNHAVPDIIRSIESGACYINLHTNNYPAGEIKGFFQPAIGSQFFTPPAAPPAAELTLPTDAALRQQEIVRFLQQATFGAKPDADAAPAAGTTGSDPFAGFEPDSIEAVAARGFAGWLSDQMAMDPGPDPETPVLQMLLPGTVYPVVTTGRRRPNGDTTFYNGSGPLSQFIQDYYQRYPRAGADPNGAVTEASSELWRAWWKSAITAPDQVRHRMAYALSQIMVVSEDGPLDERPRAVGQFYDLLYFHGLGNFRTLLEKVTLNPAMGRYLDMLGNKKPNPATGYIPNENYAREILQLFSIGLKRLHPDGTLVLDNNGLPLPTYGQDNVVGYAHTFTGWSYGTGGGSNFVSPMVVTASSHDTGEKLLLENAVLPADPAPTTLSATTSLQSSLDVIFHHPNAGPFLSRQLIQRLVTSNPSPAYVYRAARAFDDNGNGVRGDLKAVLRAILLDPEARNQAPRQQPGFGKLKEPVIRATQMLRAFRGYSHADTTLSGSRDLGLAITSPSGNVNLSLPLRSAAISYTTGTVETVTTSWIDDVLDPDGTAAAFNPTTFSFPLAAGNRILLRRQTAPPPGGLVTDANGDTNSPENGLYVFTGNGAPLTRAPEADSANELNGAWIIATTGFRDTPGTPGGSALPNTNGGTLTGNRTWQQTSVITTLGTDAVKWSLSSTGNNFRHRWEMGGLREPFQQNPLQSPTVFNFYEPDYVFLGQTGNAGLYGPEFQITSETSAITTANWFYDLTRRNSSDPASPFSYGQGYAYPDPLKKEIKLNLTPARAIAANAGTLTDYLASLLMPGQMSPRLRTLLTDYLTTITAATDADKMSRIGEALYLISMAPEFAVQR